MKYKKLTKEQILISLDRLTRFKNTRDKYLRVYMDILHNGLSAPVMRKNEIEELDYSELTLIATEILNDSLRRLCPDTVHNDDCLSVNRLLRDYENTVYNNDTETQKLLNNNILYIYTQDLISDKCPINLRWLKAIIAEPNTNLKELREKKILKYPLERLVLAEGITEETLLPAFSKYLRYDFDQKGIQIIAAGGKNQVVKMYYKLAEEVKLPIFILLDKDAEENINQIKPKLRKSDKIHLVSCGEFEDLLPKPLIVKTINRHFENFLSISESDLDYDIPTAKVLEELYRTKGLHEFKKAEFAKLIKMNINENEDISDEIRNIIDELKL